MTWTTNLPKEPGWYWWRSSRQEPAPVKLFQMSNGDLYSKAGLRVHEFSLGQWAGPIPLPEEPK
jgi:hypothetical protein